MSQVEFNIHDSHIPLWEDQSWRYAFLMGGRGNGRSGSASRYAASHILGTEYLRGALMRAVHGDIRASSWSEVMDRFEEQGIKEGAISLNGKPAEVHIIGSSMFVQIGANSLRAMSFRASAGSLTARLKSLAGFNFVWIEEAEEIGEEEFMKLDDTLRTVKGRIRIIFTLNTPPKNHWIIRRFFDLTPHPEAPGFFIPHIKPDQHAIYLPGTFRENIVNLDENTVERYIAYKSNKPDYYWQVIEGLSPEVVRGKIYNGWQLIDTIPPEARLVRFGEDFGWYPDPACVVAIYYWNGSYIIDEVAYGTELTNEFLANAIAEVDGKQHTPVIADCAEPKSIAEQKKLGINAQPCEKGKDSVDYGIKVVTTKKVFVTRRSTNVWNSFENYAWAEDKDGNPKGEPVHTWSHAMDAIRYGLVSMHVDLGGKGPTVNFGNIKPYGARVINTNRFMQ